MFARMIKTVAIGSVMVAGLMAMTGCDERLYGMGLGSLGMGGLGLGGWGYGGGYTYDGGGWGYDGGMSAAMERSAIAWDQYITGDYYGGDNDDPSTPTYWASGYEWP